MGGDLIGLSRHGGVLPIGGTFFVFSDYMRGVGAAGRPVGDQGHLLAGPTTRSASARTARPTSPSSSWRPCGPCPTCVVIRPADANETAQALRAAIEHDGPTALILSRQDLPVLEGTAERAHSWPRGPTSWSRDADGPDVVLVGTGSEVCGVRGRGAAARRARASGPGGVHAVLGALRGAGRRLPGRRPRRRAPGPVRRGGGHPSAGPGGPTTPSSSTISAPPARARRCWPTSALRPRTSPTRPGPCCGHDDAMTIRQRRTCEMTSTPPAL